MKAVSVVGHRHLIEPPTMGSCEDPQCITLAAMARAGVNELLLVASYSLGSPNATAAAPIRVCASCDEKRLRAWLEDES